MKPLREPKTCGMCGAVHTEMPENARPGEYEMWYWECACLSTLTYLPDRERTFALIKASNSLARGA